MNKDSKKSLIKTKSCTDILQNEAETSGGRTHRILENEHHFHPSPYGSFLWFYNFFKKFAVRIINDMLMSFLHYWFPNTVLLPKHLEDLLTVHNNLRAERELHTVTYSSSREQRSLYYSRIFMREFFNTFKSYVSCEDDVCNQHNTKSYEFHGTDREPIIVIVDSSCESDPSSKEILVENKYNKDTKVKNYYWKCATPIDIPSTSTECRYEVLPPHVNQTESIDELQMVAINLQNENEVALADSELDNESVVISYLRNKGAFMEAEGTLMSTKKKASLLASVAKMETILESEQCTPKLIISEIDIAPSEYVSDTVIDILIPSYPGSPRSTTGLLTTSLTSLEKPGNLNEVIDFLHHDEALLTAAVAGDVKTLEELLKSGIDVNGMDHLGRNALHFAVFSGNRHAVFLLLNAGVDPNVKDDVGMTPLSLCLMRRPSSKMASLLFEHGAQIIRRSEPMDTGLFIRLNRGDQIEAVYTDFQEAFDKVDPETLLAKIAFNGIPEFVMMCEPTKEEERILHLLIEKGYVVDDPEAPGKRQALHFAAMSNNCQLIKILIELGADLFSRNHRNETPKDVAATFNCKEAYTLLEQFEKDYYLSGNRTESTVVADKASST